MEKRRIFCIFNLYNHWFLYVASVKTTSSLRSCLIIFTKYPTKSGLKLQKCQDKKIKKYSQENISPSLGKENCVEKNEGKLSHQSGDVMPTSVYLTNYRSYCSQIIYREIVLKISENSQEPWWSTILVKLQALIPQFYENTASPRAFFHENFLKFSKQLFSFNTPGRLLLDLRLTHTV